MIVETYQNFLNVPITVASSVMTVGEWEVVCIVVIGYVAAQHVHHHYCGHHVVMIAKDLRSVEAVTRNSVCWTMVLWIVPSVVSVTVHHAFRNVVPPSDQQRGLVGRLGCFHGFPNDKLL